MKNKLLTLFILALGFINLKAQEPYIGEIRMFAGNFAPAGWAFCDGQTMAISENDALFNLIGTTYGGDGQTTFNLPDLQGRAPIHFGTCNGINYVIGEQGGSEQVTLTTNQIPSHNHNASIALNVTNGSGNADTPVNTTPAINPARGNEYNTTSNGTMRALNYSASPTTSLIGGSQPHDNMKPYLAIHYIISLFGIYPSQN